MPPIPHEYVTPAHLNQLCQKGSARVSFACTDQGLNDLRILDAQVKGGCETTASAILKGFLNFFPLPLLPPLPSSSPCVCGPRVSPGWGRGSGSFARVTLGSPTVQHSLSSTRLGYSQLRWLKPLRFDNTCVNQSAQKRGSPLRVGGFMVAERR